MDGEGEHAILLYDRDCRFCCWSLRRLLAWDRHDRIRPLALQEPQAACCWRTSTRSDGWTLGTSSDPKERPGRPDGPSHRCFACCHGGRPLAALAERVPRATDAGYAFVARHRSVLSRLVRARRSR